MRAAAGVTAFSSQSDLNLLDAYFVCFSHTKIFFFFESKATCFHIFFVFLFFPLFLVGSNPCWLLIWTVWPVFVVLFMAGCVVLIKSVRKLNFPSGT